MIDNRDCMILAVTMAAKCKPAIPADTPKVGAVILVDGEVVAVAHRGEHDHAEKVAIDEARAVGADLTRATIYTTLEPCVAGVRRRTLDSCADRIVSAALKKVVIGIHDPNKDVTGKGFFQGVRPSSNLIPCGLKDVQGVSRVSDLVPI